MKKKKKTPLNIAERTKIFININFFYYLAIDYYLYHDRHR